MSMKWRSRERNRAEEQPKELEPKDFFKHVLDTRNFEITNFWQRSNYFLVLNTGLAIGLFNIKEQEHAAIYRVLVALLGVWVCALWTRVALGSKFWQVHWENTLSHVETIYMARGMLDDQVKLFSQSTEQVKAQVCSDLAKEHGRGGRFARYVDSQVLKKPSVTLSMIALATLFTLVWLLGLIAGFALLLRQWGCPLEVNIAVQAVVLLVAMNCLFDLEQFMHVLTEDD